MSKIKTALLALGLTSIIYSSSLEVNKNKLKEASYNSTLTKPIKLIKRPIVQDDLYLPKSCDPNLILVSGGLIKLPKEELNCETDELEQ